MQLRGPKGLPLLGSVLDLRRDPLAFDERVATEYGGVAAMKPGPYRIALVSSAEGFRDVLMRDVDG